MKKIAFLIGAFFVHGFMMASESNQVLCYAGCYRMLIENSGEELFTPSSKVIAYFILNDLLHASSEIDMKVAGSIFVINNTGSLFSVKNPIPLIINNFEHPLKKFLLGEASKEVALEILKESCVLDCYFSFSVNRPFECYGDQKKPTQVFEELISERNLKRYLLIKSQPTIVLNNMRDNAVVDRECEKFVNEFKLDDSLTSTQDEVIRAMYKNVIKNQHLKPLEKHTLDAEEPSVRLEECAKHSQKLILGLIVVGGGLTAYQYFSEK